MDRYIFTPELKAATDAGEATFYASIFGNRDLGGDIVMAGAFADTISETPPERVGFLADHAWDTQHRLGFIRNLTEDAHGLLVTAQFNLEKQMAREIYSDFKMAPSAMEFSFGYDVTDYEIDGATRFIKAAKLYEVSHVIKGMNPATELVGVKGEILDEAPTLTDGAVRQRLLEARLRLRK